MTRKRVRVTAKPKPVIENPTLERLNLSKGDEIRFRRGNEDWTTGHIIGDNKDGSLEVFDEKMGNVRSFMPDQCQVKDTGPRGGTVWIDIPV